MCTEVSQSLRGQSRNLAEVGKAIAAQNCDLFIKYFELVHENPSRTNEEDSYELIRTHLPDVDMGLLRADMAARKYA